MRRLVSLLIEVLLAEGLLSPQCDALVALQLFSLISLEDYCRTSPRGNRSRWRRAILWAWWDSASGFQTINRLAENFVRQKVSEGKCLTEKRCLQLYVWHHLMRKHCVLKCTNFSGCLEYKQKPESCGIFWSDWELSTSSLWCGQPLQLPFLQMCQTQTCAMRSVVLISSVLMFVSGWI